MATIDTYLNYQARIIGALSAAVMDKQELTVASKCFSSLYAESTFKKLPKYKQDCLVTFANAKWQSMLDKYTLLLTIGLDGRKVLNKWDYLTDEERDFIRNGGKLKSAFYWLREETKCSDDGVITTIMTPTDKIYFQPSE